MTPYLRSLPIVLQPTSKLLSTLHSSLFSTVRLLMGERVDRASNAKHASCSESCLATSASTTTFQLHTQTHLYVLL